MIPVEYNKTFADVVRSKIDSLTAFIKNEEEEFLFFADDFVFLKKEILKIKESLPGTLGSLDELLDSSLRIVDFLELNKELVDISSLLEAEASFEQYPKNFS